MSKKFSGVLAVIALVVLGLAAWWQFGQRSVSSVTPSPTPTLQATSEASQRNQQLSYRGQEGKTALEILRSVAQVEAKGEGVNAYVTKINGYTASEANKEFWAFYVNGQSSQVGAGSYVTKATDTIEWKIEQY
jgi:hypothetical protein